MLNAIYTIIIYPLFLLIEFFYSFFSSFLSRGYSVISLSFVVTLFTLPLYMIAENWSEKERKIEKKLHSGVKRIKQTFSGDEQYMMLSIFYKQNHYHPIMALRSSFSLLIQVPFFIAAYNFLSNLKDIQGYSFWFIRNFGAPDAFLKIGSFSLNVLPIAMTLINCIAGFIYSKGHPLKEKIQIYACAALFLVILYDSPAGLVLYWTMNNVLSLVKNVFYKIKNPKKVLYILLCIVAAAVIFAGIFILKGVKPFYKAIAVGFGIVLPIIPLFAIAIAKYFDSRFSNLNSSEQWQKKRFAVFVFSAIGLALLSGFLIPSSLMESEPQNFCYVDNCASPFEFLRCSVFQAIGFFVFWPCCFYFLFSHRIKNIVSWLFAGFLVVALLNNFAFGGEYGPMEPIIVFKTSSTFAPSIAGFVANTLLTFAIFVLALFTLQKFPKYLSFVPKILCIGMFAFSLKNCVFVGNAFNKMTPPAIREDVEPIYHLSQTGQNVLFIMEDRYFSPLIPYVFEERKDLLERFDGFTFFPNTVSFGNCTMIGSPGVYGGYDYTPFEINLRPEKSIKEKHNEALCTMAIIFNAIGYDTTISDMPYENYSEEPVEQIYAPYPFIKRINTDGVYADTWYMRHGIKRPVTIAPKIKRNLFCFSIFKMAPPIMRRFVYHREYWSSIGELSMFDAFIQAYSVMEFLPELVAIDSEENAFVELTNLTTHEPLFLQAPDYIPVEEVTNYGNSKFAYNEQYHVVASATVKFAVFFDYLKANNVYDNTRIVIVSDHGAPMDTDTMNNTERMPFIKDNYTAALFFKDFNSRGSMKNDMTFMTNADAIDLATGGVLSDAKNPFTGKPIHKENKNDFVKIFAGHAISTRQRNEARYEAKPSDWYTVRDNIFVDDNWQQYNLKPGEEDVCK